LIGRALSNQAILLTPPGSAAIAVIRLTGNGITPFLARHFSGQPREGRCVHGSLTDRERIIDDPVVVQGPDASYVDINLHGGPWVVQSVLQLARTAGFEVVDNSSLPLQPGSVDVADATDELQLQILTHLPLATTELGLSELLRQHEAWRHLENLTSPARKMEAKAMLEDRGLWWLLHPPRIAIIGIPNAGKSTLANCLYGQERSITADLPGTTRDWIDESANISGLAVVLIDTPGIRVTEDAIEAVAIENAGGQIESADAIIVVLDGSQPLPAQAELLARYPGAIRVINKSDLSPAWAPDGSSMLHLVAKTGVGVELLRRAIVNHFGVYNRPSSPRWWTDHQQRALRELST
jgi:tRNA modification GTPase